MGNFFQIYNNLAINTYHVNPLIFVILMTTSVPLYYWGWYRLGKSVYIFQKEYKKNKNNPADIFKDNNFILALTVNRFAWVYPYLYVIFWGRNLPIIFWVIFLGWIMLSSYIFWEKLKNKLTR